MTTSQTAAPTTAAEARAIATRLEAAERDLTTRRSTARKTAEANACRAEFAHADTELQAAREAAQERWNAATQADELDLNELFAAWLHRRTTALARVHTLRAANATLNGLEPRRHEISGQHLDHRADTHDGDANEQWTLTLDRVIADHLARRVNNIVTASTNRIRTSGQHAENAIK